MLGAWTGELIGTPGFHVQARRTTMAGARSPMATRQKTVVRAFCRSPSVNVDSHRGSVPRPRTERANARPRMATGQNTALRACGRACMEVSLPMNRPANAGASSLLSRLVVGAREEIGHLKPRSLAAQAFAGWLPQLTFNRVRTAVPRAGGFP